VEKDDLTFVVVAVIVVVVSLHRASAAWRSNSAAFLAMITRLSNILVQHPGNLLSAILRNSWQRFTGITERLVERDCISFLI
jgi:uncharacterized SAM-binding protein YcdF (DUF218 family)